MERATGALTAGEWEIARARFETLLAERESPEGLAGLGTALWWLGETDAAVTALERAFAGFRMACRGSRDGPRSGQTIAAGALTLCRDRVHMATLWIVGHHAPVLAERLLGSLVAGVPGSRLVILRWHWQVTAAWRASGGRLRLVRPGSGALSAVRAGRAAVSVR